MRYLVLSALLAWGATLHAACNDAIDATTPDSRYVIGTDGTATDTRTGLTWLRCPAGYVLDEGAGSGLDDDTCVAAATTVYNWQGALQAAEDLNTGGGAAGFSDWRVPNIKELASIVEYRCESPAINESVFPGTVSSLYWSSTPRRLIDSAFAIDFATGSGTWSYKVLAGVEHPVRLVRGSP